jgi:hypothetical protein
MYSAACSKAGWAMVSFALESYGGKGQHATALLQRMRHSLHGDESQLSRKLWA